MNIIILRFPYLPFDQVTHIKYIKQALSAFKLLHYMNGIPIAVQRSSSTLRRHSTQTFDGIRKTSNHRVSRMHTRKWKYIRRYADICVTQTTSYESMPVDHLRLLQKVTHKRNRLCLSYTEIECSECTYTCVYGRLSVIQRHFLLSFFSVSSSRSKA